MEGMTRDQKILAFLNPGYGYGDGDGSGHGEDYGSGYGHGSGYGSGDGYGSGSGYGDGYSDGSGSGYSDGSGYGEDYGYGDGYGSGYGDGYGSGYGYGYGIEALNGQTVYRVDGMRTLIDVCHDTYALGKILKSDLTTARCYVVKQEGIFAHGKTLREARDALLEKLFDDIQECERIVKFMEAHELNKSYSNRDFFDWHHRLTGSCRQGRTVFAQDHGIDLDGNMTTKEFLELTKESYGGDIIRRTIEAYGEEKRK